MSELKISDIINSVKAIEKDCERVDGHGKLPDPDYKKFYNRVMGLMILLEESNRKAFDLTKFVKKLNQNKKDE